MGRVLMNFRVGQSGVEWLERMAAAAGQTTDTPTTKSDVMRAALAVARSHEDEVLKIMKERL